MLAFPSFIATEMCFYMICPSYLLICFFVLGSDIGRLVLRCPLSTCGHLLSRIALRLCLNSIVQMPQVCPIRAKCECNPCGQQSLFLSRRIAFGNNRALAAENFMRGSFDMSKSRCLAMTFVSYCGYYPLYVNYARCHRACCTLGMYAKYVFGAFSGYLLSKNRIFPRFFLHISQKSSNFAAYNPLYISY